MAAMPHPTFRAILSLLAAGLLGSSCQEGSASTAPGASALGTRTLTLGAYTTPREVYGREILPAFAELWAREHREKLEFQESYLGSGAQSRAVIGGFAADLVALSLEPDVTRIAEAGLIEHDWKAGPGAGIVTRSIVVLAVRKGNPKKVRDWDDLRQPGISILTPNAKTSGGAMWNIAAIYGAALRGQTSAPANDPAAAEKFLAEILANVSVMDKGARESMVTFENGVGDVAVTYENEVLVGRMAGRDYEYVVPRSTILIENPAAVVDRYAKEHGNEECARAFLEYLRTPEAQDAFARYGLRPENAKTGPGSAWPAVADLFTIQYFGGWPAAVQQLFAEGGAYKRAASAAGKAK